MKVPYIIQNVNHKQYLCRLLSVKDEGYTAALCIESLDKSLQEGELFSTLEVEEIEEYTGVWYLAAGIGILKKMDRQQ